MIQFCVVENNLVQEDMFNIIKIMVILHIYHTKHDIEFKSVKMASLLPIQNLKGSMRFPSVTMELGNFVVPMNFLGYEDRIHSSSWQYLNDKNYKMMIFVFAWYSFT